jgi:hypothetical protein
MPLELPKRLAEIAANEPDGKPLEHRTESRLHPHLSLPGRGEEPGESEKASEALIFEQTLLTLSLGRCSRASDG